MRAYVLSTRILSVVILFFLGFSYGALPLVDFLGEPHLLFFLKQFCYAC